MERQRQRQRQKMEDEGGREGGGKNKEDEEPTESMRRGVGSVPGAKFRYSGASFKLPH